MERLSDCEKVRELALTLQVELEKRDIKSPKNKTEKLIDRVQPLV